MENKFSWTQEFRRSWENDNVETDKKIECNVRLFNPNRKNVIRHLLVCIDTSICIEKTDYIPTIRGVISNLLPSFSGLFRNSNPLSSLSFLTCNDVFQKYSKEFDSRSLLNTVGSGQFSLLNCLKSAIDFLKVNNYNKEILLITASIGTNDVGNYDNLINEIKKMGIKVSILSICGEVTLFKKITQISNGKFYVPVNNHHFEIILNSFIEPLESLESTSFLIKLGFPKMIEEAAICTCHLTLHKKLYECPVCNTFVCSLPCQCPICEIQLVSPINISKSYYFMYPLKPLKSDCSGVCRKCGKSSHSKCEDCESLYCEDCSAFIQQELNFCIFCK